MPKERPNLLGSLGREKELVLKIFALYDAGARALAMRIFRMRSVVLELSKVKANVLPSYRGRVQASIQRVANRMYAELDPFFEGQGKQAVERAERVRSLVNIDNLELQ